MRFATATFAPWALAFGLLVTVTAHADPDPDTGGLSLPKRTKLDVAFAGASVIDAGYAVGDPQDLTALPDETEPRYQPKSFREAALVINRARKADPFIALRRGFEAKAKAGGEGASPPSPVQVAFSDGATPGVPMAFALGSVAPSPGGGLAAAPVAAPAPAGFIAAQSDLSDRPGYADLIDARDRAQQMRCLAEAVYFEARSEPEAGQAAVAQVVLNRVRSGIYPATVCGVVYQDREHPFACQFSFACEGKSLRVEEPGPWATATRIAEGVAGGQIYDPKFASAINYHAAYVRPFWAASLKRLDKVGQHIFYAMRPGLYWAPGALNGHGDQPPAMAQAGAEAVTR